jgi:adenosylhomocysteine nucleosidase
MRSLSVLIAVPPEAEAILADPAFGWREEERDLYASGSYPLRLALSGVGKAYAAYAFSRVQTGAEAVLSLGTSGGLSDEEVGSAWIVEEFAEHDMCVDSLGFPPGVTPFGPIADPIMRTGSPELRALMEAACDRAGIARSRGRAIAGDEFVNDSERALRKMALFGARLVDMETAAIAKVAASWTDIPFAALRVVSDNANHDSHGDWAANVRIASVLLDRFLAALCAIAFSRGG